MEAKELRIGNLVHAKTIGIDGQVNIDILRLIEDKKEHDYIPIPLTEEWLETFGFNHEYNEYWSVEHRYITFLLFVNSRHKTIYHFTDVERRQYHSMLSIKYVHQLQNLYHSLTEEELKVKEDASIV